MTSGNGSPLARIGRSIPSVFRLLSAKPPYDGSQLDRRDMDRFRSLEPLLDYLYEHYFRVQITGWERLPRSPVLLVANHGGGFVVPDMFLFGYAWWKRFGDDRPLHGLAHDFLFSVPPLARFFCAAGAVRGTKEMAARVLEAGRDLVVYPGGAEEMWKRFAERNRIRFEGRTGFVKLALRQGVPIVPVVTAGAHEIFVVLSEGRTAARWLGLKKLFRVGVLPVHLSLLGPMVGFVPVLPLPVQIDIELGEPIRFEGMGPADADDPLAVKACLDRVIGAMQAQLDRLAAKRPGLPILNRLPKLGELFASRRSRAGPAAATGPAHARAGAEPAGRRAGGRGRTVRAGRAR